MSKFIQKKKWIVDNISFEDLVVKGATHLLLQDPFFVSQ